MGNLCKIYNEKPENCDCDLTAIEKYEKIINETGSDLQLKMEKGIIEKMNYYLINKNWIMNIYRKTESLEIKRNTINGLEYPIDFIIGNINMYENLHKNYGIKLNPFLIITMKNYIIIKDNVNNVYNNLFFICSLISYKSSKFFNIEIIFSFLKEQEYLDKINEIINSGSFKKEEKDKPINIVDINKKNIGFYIYLSKDNPNKYNKINNINNENNKPFITSNKEEITPNKDESNSPFSIIQKLYLLFYYNCYFLNIIKREEIRGLKQNIRIINKEWLKKYKECYKYTEVIKNFQKPNINFFDNNILSNPKYSKYFENIKISLNSNMPEELKNSQLIFPIYSDNTLFKYPINFELIGNELFNLLIKENDMNEMYNSFNNNYNCLLGNNLLILIENNNNILLIYYNNIDDNNEIKDNNYKIKYILRYYNSNILQSEIQYILNLKYFQYYLFNRGIELSKYGNQNFINGIFSNFSDEKIGISVFEKPTIII